MALIKHSQSGSMVKDAIVLDFGDLSRQAESILQRAHNAAAEVLAHANEEARRLIDGAAAKGHAEGFEKGSNEGRRAGESQGRAEAIASWNEQLETLTHQWTAALAKFEADRSAMMLDAREDVLVFATEMAAKIVHRLVKVDENIIADQLVAALTGLTRPTSLAITIHPEDRPVVESVLPELLASIGANSETELRDDASIGRGGCIVNTAGGTVDAAIQTQIDRIVTALLPQREHDAALKANAAPDVTPSDTEAHDDDRS